MGIFKQFVDIVKANINDILDKAEDPEKMIKLMIVEMEEAVTKATSALAQAMANEKNLQRKEDIANQETKNWDSKAVLALKSGREDLAKEALSKKINFESQSKQYSQMRTTANQATGQLKDNLDKIKMKFDEARMKQSTLSARSQTAKAQKEFAKQMGNMSNSAFSKFDKMEEKIMKLEAEGEALGEIKGANIKEDEFAKLDNDEKMEDELAKLKKQLNM